MAVEIRLLGGLEIAANGRRVSLPTRKAEALLARLALRPGEPVGRAQLAGLLWPDRPDAQGRGSLRQALAAIRRAFEEAGAPGGPTAGGDAVALDARGVSVDVARLGAALARGGELAEALALHRGPLLAGFPPVEDTFDGWLEAERAALERRLLAAIRSALARGVSATEALALTEAALAIDPAFEEGWRARMRALAERGDRAGALREYGRCREALRRELSVAPAAETEALRRQLAGEAARPPEPTRTPTLCVLPFEILSADPAHESFARGLQEDVIGALSRFRSIRVVAPPAGRRDAAAGVDYLLVASIRAAGGRLRVAARLAAAGTDAQLWAERFEGDLADAFALQDRVAEAVAGALAVRIDEAELRAAAGRPPESLEAHALWLRGMQCLKRGTPEADLEARALFEQALARDRDYARAWAGLSLSHFNDWSCAAWERWDETERRAFELASEALRRDAHDPVTQCILGRILLYRREFERAASHLARAHALNPNEPDVLAHLSLGYAYLGEPARGLALGEAARRLNPFHPDWYLPCVAANHLVARRPREALDLLARAPDGHVDTRAFIAAARAHLGDEAGARDDARRFVERFRTGIARGKPFAAAEPVRWVLHVNPLRRAEDRDWLVEGLARAGLQAPAHSQR